MKGAFPFPIIILHTFRKFPACKFYFTFRGTKRKQGLILLYNDSLQRLTIVMDKSMMNEHLNNGASDKVVFFLIVLTST